MKKKISAVLATALCLFLASCGSGPEKANQIRIGTIAGPETELMQCAKAYAQEHYDLKIDIVTFNSYMIPNAALNGGEIDANMFQTIPFLENQIKNKGYRITPVGKTFVFPMGLYSTKIHSLQELATGATIAIPNDPSNEGRALLLMQKAGLITLKPNSGYEATVLDIASNPKQLQFIEMDAAQLPRVLSDVSLAAINTNFALPAGLDPQKDALYMEGPDSPYANVVVVRTADKDQEKFEKLMSALHSMPVLIKAKQIFGGDAIPAWEGAPKMSCVPSEGEPCSKESLEPKPKPLEQPNPSQQ